MIVPARLQMDNKTIVQSSMEFQIEIKVEYHMDNKFCAIDGIVNDIRGSIIYINDIEINIDNIMRVDYLNKFTNKK